MMWNRRQALSLLTGAASGVLARAQEPDQTIKVDVSLVNLLCSVRDKRGGYIRNLNKEDFTITEDNKNQDIRYFARETNLPLTMGLLVDVSKSQERLLDIERRAASAFFRSMLKEKDMAFLIQFGADAELLQDLTNSARLLEKGLNDIRLSVNVGAMHQGTIPSSSRPKGTIMYDAVQLAATEKLKGEVGRKAIILLTDGMDFGSHFSREEAVAAAQRSDAIIYGIYYADNGAYGGFGGGGISFGGASDGDLKKMAEETGGRVFHVDRKNTLDDVFKELQEEMRSQYALGYSPTNVVRDGGFRKIDIRTGNKDYKVQARKGYFADKG
ncbi:MAG: VWA domain-containing protein [Acidobacteriota bacterium]